MNTSILTVLAALPSIALIIYVYRKDKAEKEPFWLLGILFICGIIACVPAGYTEQITALFINSIFGKGYLHNFAEAFIGVALVEESFKFFPMKIFTWKNRNFNYRFDGIVYAVFVSLGFALNENIMYVLKYGFKTAVVRGIISVPAHMMFGVFMGMYYGISKHAENYGYTGLSKRSGKLALIIPVLIHGFFDFCLFTNNPYFVGAFYVFLIGLYIASFRIIRRISGRDYSIE